MARPALKPRQPPEPAHNEPLRRMARLRSEFARPSPPASRLQPDAVEKSLSRHAVGALLLVVLLVGGLGGWAAFTDVAGAVVANGILVVENGSQKVQHAEGGTVSQILARDDDHVAAGQILVRLDGTTIAANLAILEDQLREAFAQLARLTAEAGGSTGLTAPAGAGDLGQGPQFAALLTTQRQLLAARAEGRAQQTARLNEQIAQLRAQAAALEAQRDASRQSLAILVKEDTDLTALYAQGLVDTNRLNSVRRDRAALEGDFGRLEANIAETASTIAERNVQIGQIVADFRTGVMTDLQTLRQQIAQLLQQRIGAQDRLSHLDIRAPQAGIVHESIVHTVGGVIGAGDTLMLVVPEANAVLVEARLGQFDIDKVTTGQAVVLRFPSLDQRVTPELKGVVKSISPDLIRDPQTGQPYYAMRVAALDGEMDKLPAGTRLIPGMPVEAFAQTGERSVLSYLLHPLAEQLSRMFIEK